jgi:glycosyltransferase involved in cell wall biosynthesis
MWNKIKFRASKFLRRKGNGISILVPFHCPDPASHRAKNWEWLKKYWKSQLPAAEIIIGVDDRAGKDNRPFSKSCAVNNAAKKVSGDILVIVDADCYISTDSVLRCAKEIRHARKMKHRLWFVPYRKFFRLNQLSSQRILESDPRGSYVLPSPPDTNDILNMDAFAGTSGSAYGHWYGALIQILPKEAFEEVGGWDERFIGWGGEDHAAMRATDTLYWPHKTLPSQVTHVWHPYTQESVTDSSNKRRVWENQTESNDKLSNRYYWAQGNIDRMRKLVNEWKKAK